jgi:hypothetical protein
MDRVGKRLHLVVGGDVRSWVPGLFPDDLIGDQVHCGFELADDSVGKGSQLALGVGSRASPLLERWARKCGWLDEVGAVSAPDNDPSAEVLAVGSTHTRGELPIADDVVVAAQ